MKAQVVVEEFLVLIAKGEVEQAQEFIMENSRGNEQTISEHLFSVSMLSLSDARYRIAMYSLEAALKIAPLEDMKKKIRLNLAVIYNDYAHFLSDMTEFDEAEEFFEKSIEVNPQYVIGHFTYAIYLRKMTRYDEAEQH